MIKSYYIAKILFKLHLPSYYRCDIDKTCKISAGSVLVRVKMGKYSYTGASTYITDAVIGKFCSIGGDVHIGGGIHPTETVSTSPVFLRGKNFLNTHFAEIPYASSDTVEIGNDVWIGQNAYIKAGVKIGTGAIIGAHAVVTHDVEPYTVMAGVPARTIRKRFDDEIILKLLKLKWWDWPDEKLQQLGKNFIEPEKLFDAIKE